MQSSSRLRKSLDGTQPASGKDKRGMSAPRSKDATLLDVFPCFVIPIN